MGCLRIALILGTLLTAIITYKVHKVLFDVPPLPKIEETWWGPGKPGKTDTSIRPFKINVSEEVIKDLQQRLKNARPFTPPLEGIQQQYGMNTKLLSEIVKYWKTEYNWKGRELFLNKYPQFKTNIQGLDIHYIHVKPEVSSDVKVLPLLLLHGWPGSVREFYEMIPILTRVSKKRDYVFEVIVPSLPGYGFSDAAVRPGLGVAEVSVLFKNFMKRLGFEKYYLQGGDWGGAIVQTMAMLFPEKILGVHSNMCFVNTPLSNLVTFLGSYYPRLVVDEEHESKVYPLSSRYKYMLEESGYMHLQATKPDTVGAALNDSPVGLAAYIIEKFTTWTNPEWRALPDGGLLKKYDYTALLDNVMIYWVTGSITTSMRLYSETFNIKQFSYQLESIPVNAPAACARYSYELVYQPEVITKLKYKNLLHTADYNGGHFAAFEGPNVLAEDVFIATNKFLEFHDKSHKA